ncbi:MAG: gamma-glutamyltransferase [Deltaproteobacteria bacterium]|nr:gamma-glutamyltransferase [Deltaproteobacteria bacterium]
MDAAVATAFALGACEPAASGLGGQTMMLIRSAELKKTIALDGSSRAPNRAVPGKVGPKKRLRGHRATTVPSTPATLEYARSRFGTLPLDVVLAPAIRIAQEGFEVSELLSNLTKRIFKLLRKGPAAPFFLKGGSRRYRPGEILKQPVLARTLSRLAQAGIEDFYTGEIGHLIHDDMVANNGLIRDDDLAQIPWPMERQPLSCRFGSLRVRTFPPPAAGRTLVQMLNILSNFEPKHRNLDTPRGALLLARVIRRAFLDRQDRPHEPNFYPQAEEKRMVSRDYAERVARQLKRRTSLRGETTHLSVMDRWGNVVALTQSIERVYGSCAASPELGFLYNDYMSAFEHEDISHPYHLRPNAVPWASVAPTIVWKNGRPWLAIGSPGSERITPSILQVLLRLEKQSLYEAIEAPRLHCSLEGVVSLEVSRMRDDVIEALEGYGYEIDEREPYSFYLGCVQAVMRERGTLVGVADPRRDGAAGGCRK